MKPRRVYECKYCPEILDTGSELGGHISSQHQGESDRNWVASKAPLHVQPRGPRPGGSPGPTVPRGSYDGVRLHNHRLFASMPPVLMLQAPEWTLDAPCAQVDPEMFYPEKGGSSAAAKKVCAACPVRAACLQYALDQHDDFGIYGGLSARQRRGMRAA